MQKMDSRKNGRDVPEKNGRNNDSCAMARIGLRALLWERKKAA
jgi:hypothetical protein